MHRCLSISEIVSNICDLTQCGAERKFHSLNPGTTRTLAALARTCRAFQNPALNVLWRNQSTVLHVIDCMPEDIWEWPDEDSDAEISLKRPIFPEDWERPLLYARRVRHFNFSRDEWLTSMFYDILRVSLPVEHLFPNIESLEWDTKLCHVFPRYRLLVGPRLTKLNLGVCQSAVHLSLLLDLATQCPRLQEVVIECSPELDVSVQRQAFSFVAKQFKELRSLEVACLDGPSLDHLSSLPSLECITLSRQPPPSVILARTQVEECHLHMESMTIKVTDARAVSEVLSRFQTRPCATLEIELPRDTPAPVFLECCKTVVTQRHEHPPSSISIQCEFSPTTINTVPDAGQIAVYKIPATLLSLFFVFENLTDVTLEAPVGFDLDNDSLASLARAWPRIERLELSSTMFKNIPSRATLLALVPFARHCPSLRWLQFSLNAKVVPKWQTLAPSSDAPRPQQRSLFLLTVRDSPVGSPLAVAVFLSSLFPKLRSISSERNGGVDAQWNAVEKALPLLSIARTEERYWTRPEE